MSNEAGWKPIPLSLKIISVLLIMWIFGSIMGLSMRYESGLPFFGVFIYRIPASLVVLFLDIVAPIVFLFGLWQRKSWAVLLAILYITIFILNGTVAFFAFREQLGFSQIFFPSLVNFIFLAVIYSNKKYFN